jgi:hypothetical protein
MGNLCPIANQIAFRHGVSGYSDVFRKTQKSRYSRLGHGHEETPGKADTPGFEMRVEAAIVQDSRGFQSLDLPRNNRRVTQSSLLGPSSIMACQL